MILCKLLSCMDRSTFEPQVISLTPLGPMTKHIEALGVPVRALGMRRGVPDPLSMLRLALWLRQDPPDVVQTWVSHADLVGGLATRVVGGVPVAWGIRQSTLDPR